MSVKYIIKKTVSNAISPFYRISESLNKSNNVRVLVYHSINEQDSKDRLGLRISRFDFLGQMQSLKEWGYEVLDIGSIFGKPPSDTKIKRKSIILTFDDGYKDFIYNAIPILEEFGYPVTLFVTIEDLQGIKRKITDNYWDTWDKISWSELKSILRNNKVSIGSHGFSHTRFNQLTYNELRKEIVDSKKILENELGRPVDLFSYPHGTYNRICLKLLREAGYKAAFSGKPGLFSSLAKPHEINRTEISNHYSLPSEFRKRINGSYDWTALKNIIFG